jgi:hypothetical protein
LVVVFICVDGIVIGVTATLAVAMVVDIRGVVIVGDIIIPCPFRCAKVFVEAVAKSARPINQGERMWGRRACIVHLQSSGRHVGG